MNNLQEKLIQELNPAQKKAVENPLHSCTKIVAGAGTGKTKIISKRFTKLVLDLIEQNIESPISKILVITFTDKAANEMKSRIVNELNVNGLNSFEDEFWISTFHGFCSKILRKHAIEVNLSPDFELAEESTLEEIYENIIKTLKYNEFQEIKNLNKICSSLNLETNLLDIKNLNKLSRINSIDNIFTDIFKTIKKIKSLGLTPKEFLEKTLNATKTYTDTVSTLPFGATTAEDYVINWQNHLKPYIDDFCIFEKECAFDDLCKKSLLICKNRSSKAEKWSMPENYHEKLTDFYKMETYLTKVTALIYAIYQATLEEKNIADFDDLINKTIYILKNNKLIKAYYQKFFQHLIIDEFQDTNGSQLELIKLLLNETKPNITFVGDRKQSIYGFRYAQMENLEVLHRHIENKYSQKYPEIKLETNYRSSEQVLNAVNHVTKEDLKLDEILAPAPFNKGDYKEEFVKNTKITGTNSAFERKNTEAKYIASEIKFLKEHENVNFKDFAILVKSHAQSELVEKVLTSFGIPSIKKTNKSFFDSPVIKNAIAVLRLIKNPRDEIALTRILKINLSDKELFNIKTEIDNEFSKLETTNTKKHQNLCEKIITLYENKRLNIIQLQSIYDAISLCVKAKSNTSIFQLFLDFEHKIKIYNAKTEIEKFQNENNLRTFEKIISDFEQKKNFVTISSFLDYFEKISTERNFELPTVLSKEIDAVQILTIHASKGLEFPYTFVCSISNETVKTDGNIIFDLQYGKKPGFGLLITKLDEQESAKSHIYKNVWQKPRDLNEAIRVFYVAASRAEKYLNILTFDETGKSKPAYYTKNFPNSITQKEINPDEIEISKATIIPPEIPIMSQPTAQTQNKICHPKQENYKFSFSKLNTFHTCPKKFLLKYKYGFTSLKSRNKGAEIGTIIHKLIYNSLVYKKELTETDIFKILENYNITKDTKDAVLENYKNFLDCSCSLSKIKNNKYFAERNFNFEYKLEDKKVEFTGDIDLLIKNPDNTYKIIDFKTNINLKEEDKLNYYKQLYLYKKALEAEGLDVKSAEILSLSGNTFNTTIQLTDEDKVATEFNTLLKNAILCLENETTTKKGTNCQFCEYSYACNYFSSTN